MSNATTGLCERLAAIRAAFRAAMPEEKRALMQRAVDDLSASGQATWRRAR